MRKYLFATIITAVYMLAQQAEADTNSYEFTMKQIVCDTVRYTIVYDMTYQDGVWTNQIDTMVEPMRLDIGDRCTRFYSYAAFQSDSINAANAAKGETMMTYSETVSWQVYKNYPKEGCFTFLDDISGFNYYAVTEQAVQPQWTLCPDSTATILGYQCRLATATYKGRQWSAWYAEDIPMNAGPWKLCGLPGLILRAYDSGRTYVFEATAMRNADGTPMMYQGCDYEPVSYAELKKEYDRYYADPFGYVRLYAPNLRRIVTDDGHGTPMPAPKNLPHNQIELSE